MLEVLALCVVGSDWQMIRNSYLPVSVDNPTEEVVLDYSDALMIAADGDLQTAFDAIAAADKLALAMDGAELFDTVLNCQKDFAYLGE